MRALSTLLTNTLVTLPRRAILGSAISAMALGGTGNAASAEDQLPKTGGYVQFCNEDTMSQKAHGTSEKPVQPASGLGLERELGRGLSHQLPRRGV